MNIIVAGGTGFIGQAVVKALTADGHTCTILTRRVLTSLVDDPTVLTQYREWTGGASGPWTAIIDGADAVINLAGEPVASGRWTKAKKRRMRESRLVATRGLVDALGAAVRKPRVLLNASAMGLYGDRGDEILTEDAPAGLGFLPETCVAWEAEAANVSQYDVREVRLRIGLVLGRDGGALAHMLPIFRCGLGGRLGNGHQWMSWIHIDDLVGLILHALHDETIRGPINGVAPHPVTNREFTETLGGLLRKPTPFPLPTVLLRLLFGEMSTLMLDSMRIQPDVANRTGYQFLYPHLSEALRQQIECNT